MKITSKLVITIIIVSLISMLGFEMIYNKVVYEDYVEMRDALEVQKNRVDYLYNHVLKLTQYVVNKEVK